MSEYHEPDAELSNDVRDLHRALTSLKEEIEAVDWYHQRWSTSHDETLRSVLAHNRDEEIEHACMMLEWLRRNSPRWDEQLRKYLFKDGPISDVAEGEVNEAHGTAGDLGIGNLRRPR
jgi:ferritin-like protein